MTLSATVGVVARFEFKPGHYDEVRRFFARGRMIVESQPATTKWTAFRMNETTYGAFASFASEADREALLASGGPVLSATFGHLFASPPTFEMVEVIESRA